MSQMLYPCDDRNVPLPARVDGRGPVKFATRSITEMYGPLLTAGNRSSGLGGTWTGPEPGARPVSRPTSAQVARNAAGPDADRTGRGCGFVTFVVAKSSRWVIPGLSGNGPMVQVDCCSPNTVVLLLRELAVTCLVPFVAQIPCGMLPVYPLLSWEVMRVSRRRPRPTLLPGFSTCTP
jgi:hypothetical protein